MSCTGTFTLDRGGPPVPGVRLSLDRVRAWAKGETLRARLPQGSHHAYRPGSGDWFVRLGFFLVLLGLGIYSIGYGAFPAQSKWSNRITVTGATVAFSCLPVPVLAWLMSLLI
jgi:hypothetical protein